MNCARVNQVLDAYLDAELDDATTAEIDAHLATCGACTALRAERDTLGALVRDHAPYFAAPERLRCAVHRSLTAATARRGGERPLWRHAIALAAVTGALGVAVGFWLGRMPAEDPLREQVIASHVASLGTDRRLVDIASADRHAIKPWFAGRTAFAPPVRDLSREGFELVGARLDQVGEAPAAAVVYRVRNHYVNLFIWLAEGNRPEPVGLATVRGFGLATWAENGLRFAAVSDVDRRDLERFAGLASGP